MLTLDVEFLLGVCFAAESVSSVTPEFPPQMDRVFSALTDAWGARGNMPEEQAALMWLEDQEPPLIHALPHHVRDAPPVFVPTNDSTAPDNLVRRVRQERRFPAAIPESSLVCYAWPSAEPSEAVFESLQLLAHHTVRVGRAVSLVRCYFRRTDPAHPQAGVPCERRVYPGRLAELEADFRIGRRSTRGASVPRRPLHVPAPLTSTFSGHWHVFAHSGGCCPNLRKLAYATQAFRDMLLSGFDGREAPEAISGHIPGTNMPTRKPHLAIFPLANVGWNRSDGRLMGLALCLPAEDPEAERALFAALRHVNLRQMPHDTECREFNIGLPGHRFWRVLRDPSPLERSLRPERYCRAARTWATVTPVVLDRRIRVPARFHASAVSLSIAEACTHIGLPRPVAVVPDFGSAIRECPPARRVHPEPAWLDWALPSALSRDVSAVDGPRELTHALIRFDRPVKGPVALGAGRFFGLGLCLPLEEPDAAQSVDARHSPRSTPRRARERPPRQAPRRSWV